MKREAPGARLCESQQRAMAQSSPGSPGNPVCQCAQISLQFLCRCMECSINNAVADCRNAHVILCLRAGVRCCGSQTRAPERDSGRDGSKQSGISRQSCLPMRADEPSIPLPLHGIFNQQCRRCRLPECAHDPAPACCRTLLRVTDPRSGARPCESQQRPMAQSSPGSPGNPVCQCAQMSLQFLCRCMEYSINNAVAAGCRNAHVILRLRAGVHCCGSRTRAPEPR